MTCKVTGTAYGEIDVKRFYIPGIKIKGKCKHCGKKVVFDLSEHYITNPVIGGTNQEWFYCEACDQNTELNIKIDISVTVIE